MSKWNYYKLGDLIRSVSETFQFTNEEVVFLNTSDISFGKIINHEKFHPSILPGQAKKKIQKDDFLFSEIRPANGRYALVKNDVSNYVVSTKLMVLRCGNKIIPEYLYLFLTSKSNLDYLQMIAEDRSGTFPQITFDNISVLDINLPPLPEQKRIAEILISLDNKIDLLHRQNETLEALAETLFRQWFIVEADESWEVGTVDDEFDFVMGQSPLGSTFNEDGEGTIFYQGRTDFGFRFPSPRIYTTAPTRMAKRLDTLISVRAPVGDMNMAFEDCCLGRGVAAFRYKHNSTYYSYTYYKLRSLMEQIKQFEDNGSVFGSIGKDDFKKLENVIPSMELIEKFQIEISPLDNKILLNTTQIKTLTQLRDTLLPKLMSGEVRVETVQEEMA